MLRNENLIVQGCEILKRVSHHPIIIKLSEQHSMGRARRLVGLVEAIEPNSVRWDRGLSGQQSPLRHLAAAVFRENRHSLLTGGSSAMSPEPATSQPSATAFGNTTTWPSWTRLASARTVLAPSTSLTPGVRRSLCAGISKRGARKVSRWPQPNWQANIDRQRAEVPQNQKGGFGAI